MNKLVSILIASRKRFSRLIKTIESIYETSDKNNLEILIRFDDDDKDSLNNLTFLEKYKEVKYFIGSRMKGYGSHHEFMNELAEHATGKWNFFFDDDVIIIGKDWDKQLETIPTEGHIVHPEFYWLNNCKYGSGSCDPVAICVPNNCWKKYYPHLCHPIDAYLQNLLKENGWENHWLKGIIIHHEWRRLTENND